MDNNTPSWFSYDGRYTRAQFWPRYLLSALIVGVIMALIAPVLTDPYTYYTVQFGIIIIITAPLLIKRMHDRGHCGALIWIQYALGYAMCIHNEMSRGNLTDSVMTIALAMLGTSFTLFIVILVRLCRDSQKGTNQYGPSSKYPD